MSEELTFLVRRAACVLRDCIAGEATELEAVGAIRTAYSRAEAECFDCQHEQLVRWYHLLAAALPGRWKRLDAAGMLSKIGPVVRAAEDARRCEFAESY